MQGDPAIISMLNDVLTAELTAINQYFIHAKMCSNWGYGRLAAHSRDESIEEMKHADEIIERILFFEGVPNMQRLNPVRVGETVTVVGDLELCRHGLHASKRVMDALRYANGKRLALCRVTLGGEVIHSDDKSVGNERTVIAMLDADTTERLLHDFARWCALQATIRSCA